MPKLPYADQDSDSEILVAKKLKKPDQYRVILLNDDYTTMDFVVEILCRIFHKSIEDATTIMMSVHRNGRGECGLYTLEIAESKVEQVHYTARNAGFPLKCIMEKV
ncbi:MAG: ATP-dependent Clp protease adapter ClpS [Desulfovibrionaceae bacterium]|nr:ATP-dependent Clp protease adapter ClpS [Desulfovibrionaceae bacterium]